MSDRNIPKLVVGVRFSSSEYSSVISARRAVAITSAFTTVAARRLFCWPLSRVPGRYLRRTRQLRATCSSNSHRITPSHIADSLPSSRPYPTVRYRPITNIKGVSIGVSDMLTGVLIGIDAWLFISRLRVLNKRSKLYSNGASSNVYLKPYISRKSRTFLTRFLNPLFLIMTLGYPCKYLYRQLELCDHNARWSVGHHEHIITLSIKPRRLIYFIFIYSETRTTCPQVEQKVATNNSKIILNTCLYNRCASIVLESNGIWILLPLQAIYWTVEAD